MAIKTTKQFKAKIKAEGLDAAALAKLGLVRVETLSLKLKAKSAA